MTVRWDDDGRREDVRISSDATFMKPGTLRHEAFVDLDGLTTRLESDPVPVLVQLLREHPRSSLTALEIKRKLGELGLAQTVLDKAWRKAQSGFKTHAHVRVNKLKYRWRPTGFDRPAFKRQEEQVDREPSAAPGKAEGDIAPEAAALPGQGVAAGAIQVQDVSPPWARAFADALRDGPGADAKVYAERPLGTAVRLARLDDEAIERLIASIRESDRGPALALLAALPRGTRAVESWDDADPVVLGEVLDVGADELRKDRSTATAAAQLVQRAATAPVSDGLIALATALLAVDRGKTSLKAVDRMAKSVGDRLFHMPDAERAALDLDAVAKLLTALPFTRQGGRAAVLAAVGQVWPERAADEIWWRGLTLDALTEFATDFLGLVAKRPEVAKAVIAPLMARELSEVSSRVRLAGLLALPTELVEHLPPEAMAEAFRRVATVDSTVDAWVRLLGQEDGSTGSARN
ncbi:hypothetical protein BZB76_0658 [Actinomadura pelletieri DSM 43383]|uniref:Uncharacterized protein n=1 Tax=Actinomadura pelletieri DSM 43383 TaxID=1120940 RepID=A0A495QYD0_9ACTN|nr:hypothetical protein [Actinomadura pelletieri]RKS79209.1 hypothetical protein BZB76_0658 [Actinomadura pelletieri DSM 43383]